MQNFRQDFKMPHLFREDLEKLEAIIKELSPREYRFETKDFECKVIQEIPQDAERLNDFHIQTHNPYISLDFNKNSAYIYSSDNTIKIMGAIKKIIDVVAKRERKFLWYLSNLATWLAPIFLWTPLYLTMFLEKETIKPNKILILASISIALLAFIWWIAGYRISLHNFSVVEFRYRKDKLNFLTRNKDQIIIGVIVTIFTVLATLLFQKIFK